MELIYENEVTYMGQVDMVSDFDAYVENRATSVLAAYRPLGIWPATIDTTVAIPAGSSVQVELYLATDSVSVVRPTGVLMAGDRVLGTGCGTPMPTIGSGSWIVQGSPVGLPGGAAIDQDKCQQLGVVGWTKFNFSFITTRPANAGEQLTVQVQLIGTRAWAFGYDGQHRSLVTIFPAPLPPSGLDFGVTITGPAGGSELVALGTATFPDLGDTETGNHPTRKRVDLAMDDADFTTVIEATLDEASGRWIAPLGWLAAGAHTIYARAAIDQNYSPMAAQTFCVSQLSDDEQVEWQVVTNATQPAPAYWRTVNDGLQYSFEVNPTVYGKGTFQLYVQFFEGYTQTAISWVTMKLSGK